MFAAFTILSMCVSVAVLTDDHQPCQSPSMTGELEVINTNKGAYAVGGYVYDSAAKKLRFTVEEKESFNSSLVQDVLMFFEEGVFYAIDNKTQSCTKKSMLQPALNPLELPSNANFITTMQMGRASVLGEGLQFHLWRATAPGLKGPYFQSFSKGCLLLENMYTLDFKTDILISNNNVELEIKDPERLTLPSFCEDAKLEGTAKPFFHFFL